MNLQQHSVDDHIVILTGSTFQSSGLNKFALNIAISLKKQNYRVTVICQDRNAQNMPSVDSYIEGDFSKSVPLIGKGELRVIVPNVGGIIPVYSGYEQNEFPGVISKPIQDMTEDEIENHVTANIKCLKEVIEHDRPFKVLANILILSAFIVGKGLEGTDIPFEIIVPGIGLTFTIKPNPRLWKWVVFAFEHTQTIFQHTENIKNIFLDCFSSISEQYKLKEKVKVIQPGVKPEKYTIPESYKKCEEELIFNMKQIISKSPKEDDFEIQTTDFPKSPEEVHSLLLKNNKKLKASEMTLEKDLLEKWIPYSEDDETVVYIGALINNKGIGELIAIAPKLISQRPKMKFIFCGFGPYKEHLKELMNAYEEGNLEKAKLIGQAGDFISEVNIEDHFIKISKEIKERIIICGLANEKKILAYLLPLCKVEVSPSRLKESCSVGIVESMCCGVVPIMNDHSWFSEVLNIMEKDYPELTKITRVKREDFFKELPQTIINTLDFIENNKLKKQEFRERIRKIAINNYSWDHTASILAGRNTV